MAESLRGETSLARPIFTEERPSEESTGREEEQKGPQIKVRKELERLKNQTAVPGRATIGMMQEFKEFPWTQDVIITMGRREEVLMSFLEVYLDLDGDTLKYWKSEFEL